GGDDLVLPTGSPASSTPTQLQMAAGNGQIGVAGSPLPTPVRVRLLDESGNGMAGQTVTWVVSTGGGNATPQSTTDSEGYAEATWTLGSPGSNTLNAVVSGLGHVTFTATATDGGGGSGNNGGGSGTGTVPSAAASTVSADPASIQVASGVSTIRVTIRDDSGLPVPGVVVTLSASGSGNTLSQPQQPTGNDGVAVGTLKSDVAGTKDVMAVVNGTMQINQTAQVFVTAAPASRIAAAEGDNQSAETGQQVPVPPAARVTNSLGEPVAGVEVTFAVTKGGGSINGASQITNAEGIARVGSWTLGPNAGRNTLQARAGSLNGSPVVFNATATGQEPPPPPQSTGQPDHFQFRVQPHDVGVNQWFSMEVAILDASGNVVPLNRTQIYVGLWPERSDVPDNTRLAGDRFVDTNSGVAVFNLYITERGRYRFMARSDYLPKNLGPYGPELFSNTFEVH
ncbi:MAG TPA: Ig-like domain-containing protein, partial [Gemmatimonadales bacterium]|nr:Ig-like domain-containing protein [Gemmatimonadales bacterium]